MGAPGATVVDRCAARAGPSDPSAPITLATAGTGPASTFSRRTRASRRRRRGPSPAGWAAGEATWAGAAGEPRGLDDTGPVIYRKPGPDAVRGAPGTRPAAPRSRDAARPTWSNDPGMPLEI